MKRIFEIVLIIVAFVSCDLGQDPSINSAEIKVNSENGEVNKWYNVDQNILNWNSLYFNSSGVTITLISEDESYNKIISIDNISGNLVTDEFIFTDDTESTRIPSGNYFIRISDGNKTCDSPIIYIDDAQNLTRTYGDIEFGNLDTNLDMTIRNNSPWNVNIKEWTIVDESINGVFTYDLPSTDTIVLPSLSATPSSNDYSTIIPADLSGTIHIYIVKSSDGTVIDTHTI